MRTEEQLSPQEIAPISFSISIIPIVRSINARVLAADPRHVPRTDIRLPPLFDIITGLISHVVLKMRSPPPPHLHVPLELMKRIFACEGRRERPEAEIDALVEVF